MARQGSPVADGQSDLSAAEREHLDELLDQTDPLEAAGDHRAAIGLYDQIIAACVDSANPERRRRCMWAMVYKARCLARLEQREAALPVNQEVVARFGDDLSMTMARGVAQALAQNASNYDKLGRGHEEIACYDETIRRFGGMEVLALRQRVAWARWARALSLRDLGRTDEAIEAMMESASSAGADDTDIRLRGVYSAINLADLLVSLGRHQDAVHWYEVALHGSGHDADDKLRRADVTARIGLIRAQVALGQTEPAAAAYRQLLALPDSALDEARRTKLTNEFGALLISNGVRKLQHLLFRR